MRPIVSEQNPLRYPLNEIFGTRAYVRLLRVMANEVEGPLTVSDAAIRAGLTVPGAQKALEKMLRSGFISQVGGGRKHQYEIRRSDRLMRIVLQLFQAEQNRYELLMAAIRNEIQKLQPPPQAAWMQLTSNEIGEPLILGLFHDSMHLTKCLRQLQEGLQKVETDFDLIIDLEGYTKADVQDLNLDTVAVLYGVLPEISDKSSLRPTRKALSHQEKDRQLEEVSRQLSAFVKKDTSLIRRAKDHIDRLLRDDPGMAHGDLKEWRDILNTYSIQRLRRFLISTTERATRLRQSNPFFAVLSSAERDQLIHGSEKKNEPRST